MWKMSGVRANAIFALNLRRCEGLSDRSSHGSRRTANSFGSQPAICGNGGLTPPMFVPQPPRSPGVADGHRRRHLLHKPLGTDRDALCPVRLSNRRVFGQRLPDQVLVVGSEFLKMALCPGTPGTPPDRQFGSGAAAPSTPGNCTTRPLGRMGQAIGENGDRILPRRPPEHLPVQVFIAVKAKEEPPVMAAVSEVIEPPGNEVAVGPWHVRSIAESGECLQAKSRGRKQPLRPPATPVNEPN
jgi:hypothetical protein